jgi:hypothetical protein
VSETLPAPDPRLFRTLRRSDVYELDAAVRLARIYPTTGAHPVNWDQFRTDGPLAGGRFDHHVPADDRGIWYGATNMTATGQPVDALLGAAAETYADTFTIDRAMNGRHLVLCAPVRPLRVLRLDSSWLSAAHGNGAISAGPRPRAQEWSRAIYDHYPELDGLYYTSSNHPASGCVALYERAQDAITTPRLLRPLTAPGLTRYLEHVAYELGWPLT